MGAINRAEVIGSHQCFDDLNRRLNKRRAHADSGVVDENIDLAEVGENAVDHFANLIELGHITRDGSGSRTSRLHFGRYCLQSLRRTTTADNDGASRRQIDGEAPADAVRCAGNQDDSILKCHLYATFLYDGENMDSFGPALTDSFLGVILEVKHFAP